MKKNSILLIVLAGLTVAVTLLYVRSRFVLVELSYNVSEKRALKSKLEQNLRALNVELATLRSPQRIERMAQEKLHLKRHPSSVSVVILDEESAP